MSVPSRRGRWSASAALLVLSLVLPASAASAAEITGTSFRDLDRDGVRQSGESAIAGHWVQLSDGHGNGLRAAQTDASGRYAFTGLADGTYRLDYDRASWLELRRDWAPSTLPTVWPARTITVTGSAVVDFGWRPITRSTDESRPLSTYVGPSGLTAKSYNDAFSARALHDLVATGTVGREAQRITVAADLGAGSRTVTSPGSTHDSFRSTAFVSWENLLDDRSSTLSHEYGHAWSLYYAHVVQQDPSMRSYLQARGLAGDPRIDSSYRWDTDELIAEDYRQLLGPPEARTRSQLNTEIPFAEDVAGLRTFLAEEFTAPPLATGLAVNPTPVKSSGTVSFALAQNATVTVRVLSPSGAVCATLLSAPRNAGSVSTKWDRRCGGARAKGGTYTAAVTADTGSRTSTARLPFGVA